MKVIILLAAVFTNNVYAQQLVYADSSIVNTNNKAITAATWQMGVKSMIVPAAFIMYGCIALENDGLKQLDNSAKLEIREDHPFFLARADNYLQYVPGVAVYGLYAVGVKGKNNLRDKTVIYALSSIISSVVVTGGKRITQKERPDGSSFTSFPSGHTANAFQGAEFLRLEYRDVSPWYGVGGYLVATATGALRVYNNKHWISDVVAGAGIGILSTRLAYWIYPAIKKKLFRNKASGTVIVPYYKGGSFGAGLVHQF